MNATRDTSTGLNFEKKVILNKEGINLSKNNLYKFLKNKGIEWNKIISRKLLPDEAYYNEETSILIFMRKNFKRPKGPLMKSHKPADLKFGNFLKLAMQSGLRI